jgi:hypothetical protein
MPMIKVLSHQWLRKKKDHDHIPDVANDNNRKQFFMKAKKKQTGISDTLTNPRVKCQTPKA